MTYSKTVEIFKKFGILRKAAIALSGLKTNATRLEKTNAENALIRALNTGDENVLNNLREILREQTYYSVVLLSDEDMERYETTAS